MQIAIIGAGVAGLTTAKVLLQAGHDVTVIDRVEDVGGVWSASRRYPGLTTQSPKAQYSFSDFPMAKSFPEWPSGAQVQEYLVAYAAHFSLDAHLHLGTDVVRATPLGGGRWSLETRPTAGGASTTTEYDGLVVANGVFCEPAMPDLPGLEAFTAAGGRVLAGTELHDVESARGQARRRHRLRQVGVRRDGAAQRGGRLDGRHRAAAAVEGPPQDQRHRELQDAAAHPDGRGAVPLHPAPRHGEVPARPGNGLRRTMLNSIGSVSVRQFKLKQSGPGPRRPHGGHRHRCDRPGDRGLLRGCGRRHDHRPPRPDGRAAARRRRPHRGGARRRHGAAGRPRGLLDRVHPGRAVPRPGTPPARCSTQPGTSCCTGRSSRSASRGCGSTATTPRSSARSTPRWRRSGSRPTSPARCRCPSRRRRPPRSPSRWRSWTTSPTATTAAGRRSSRSRCTTSTRCSATSASTSPRRPRLALAQPGRPGRVRRDHPAGARRPTRAPEPTAAPARTHTAVVG